MQVVQPSVKKAEVLPRRVPHISPFCICIYKTSCRTPDKPGGGLVSTSCPLGWHTSWEGQGHPEGPHRWLCLS